MADYSNLSLDQLGELLRTEQQKDAARGLMTPERAAQYQQVFDLFGRVKGQQDFFAARDANRAQTGGIPALGPDFAPPGSGSGFDVGSLSLDEATPFQIGPWRAGNPFETLRGGAREAILSVPSMGQAAARMLLDSQPNFATAAFAPQQHAAKLMGALTGYSSADQLPGYQMAEDLKAGLRGSGALATPADQEGTFFAGLGAGLGSIVPQVAVGLATQGAGAAPAVAGLVGAGMGALQSSQGVYDEAIQRGMDPVSAQLASDRAAGFTALTSAIPGIYAQQRLARTLLPGAVQQGAAGPIESYLAKKITNATASRVLSPIASGGLEEGVQETGDQAFQNWLLGKPLTQDLAQTAAISGLLGGTLGSVGSFQPVGHAAELAQKSKDAADMARREQTNKVAQALLQANTPEELQKILTSLPPEMREDSNVQMLVRERGQQIVQAMTALDAQPVGSLGAAIGQPGMTGFQMVGQDAGLGEVVPEIEELAESNTSRIPIALDPETEAAQAAESQEAARLYQEDQNLQREDAAHEGRTRRAVATAMDAEIADRTRRASEESAGLSQDIQTENDLAVQAKEEALSDLTDPMLSHLVENAPSMVTKRAAMNLLEKRRRPSIELVAAPEAATEPTIQPPAPRPERPAAAPASNGEPFATEPDPNDPDEARRAALAAEEREARQVEADDVHRALVGKMSWLDDLPDASLKHIAENADDLVTADAAQSVLARRRPASLPLKPAPKPEPKAPVAAPTQGSAFDTSPVSEPQESVAATQPSQAPPATTPAESPAETPASVPQSAATEDAGVESEPKFTPKSGGSAPTRIDAATIKQIRDEALKAVGIDPKFVEQLRANPNSAADQKALEPHGMSGDVDLAGMFMNGAITVAMDQSAPEAIRTGRHEIGHAFLELLRAANAPLAAAVIEDIGQKNPKTGLETKKQRAARLEEAFSDALADWWEGKFKGPRPALLKAFQMFRSFVDRIGAKLREMGFTKAADVLGTEEGARERRLDKTFHEAAEGKYAPKQEAGESGAKAAPKQAIDAEVAEELSHKIDIILEEQDQREELPTGVEEELRGIRDALRPGVSVLDVKMSAAAAEVLAGELRDAATIQRDIADDALGSDAEVRRNKRLASELEKTADALEARGQKLSPKSPVSMDAGTEFTITHGEQGDKRARYVELKDGKHHYEYWSATDKEWKPESRSDEALRKAMFTAPRTFKSAEQVPMSPPVAKAVLTVNDVLAQFGIPAVSPTPAIPGQSPGVPLPSAGPIPGPPPASGVVTTMSTTAPPATYSTWWRHALMSGAGYVSTLGRSGKMLADYVQLARDLTASISGAAHRDIYIAVHAAEKAGEWSKGAVENLLLVVEKHDIPGEIAKIQAEIASTPTSDAVRHSALKMKLDRWKEMQAALTSKKSGAYTTTTAPASVQNVADTISKSMADLYAMFRKVAFDKAAGVRKDYAPHYVADWVLEEVGKGGSAKFAAILDDTARRIIAAQQAQIAAGKAKGPVSTMAEARKEARDFFDGESKNSGDGQLTKRMGSFELNRSDILDPAFLDYSIKHLEHYFRDGALRLAQYAALSENDGKKITKTPDQTIQAALGDIGEDYGFGKTEHETAETYIQAANAVLSAGGENKLLHKALDVVTGSIVLFRLVNVATQFRNLLGAMALTSMRAGVTRVAYGQLMTFTPEWVPLVGQKAKAEREKGIRSGAIPGAMTRMLYELPTTADSAVGKALQKAHGGLLMAVQGRIEKVNRFGTQSASSVLAQALADIMRGGNSNSIQKILKNTFEFGPILGLSQKNSAKEAERLLKAWFKITDDQIAQIKSHPTGRLDQIPLSIKTQAGGGLVLDEMHTLDDWSRRAGAEELNFIRHPDFLPVIASGRSFFIKQGTLFLGYGYNANRQILNDVGGGLKAKNLGPVGGLILGASIAGALWGLWREKLMKQDDKRDFEIGWARKLFWRTYDNLMMIGVYNALEHPLNWANPGNDGIIQSTLKRLWVDVKHEAFSRGEEHISGNYGIGYVGEEIGNTLVQGLADQISQFNDARKLYRARNVTKNTIDRARSAAAALGSDLKGESWYDKLGESRTKEFNLNKYDFELDKIVRGIEAGDPAVQDKAYRDAIEVRAFGEQQSVKDAAEALNAVLASRAPLGKISASLSNYRVDDNPKLKAFEQRMIEAGKGDDAKKFLAAHEYWMSCVVAASRPWKNAPGIVPELRPKE